MAYARLDRDTRGGGGGRGRFSPGIGNPNFGGVSTQRPTGRMTPGGGGGGGGSATVYSYSPTPQPAPIRSGVSGPTYTRSGSGGGTPGWLLALRRKASQGGGFNEPDIPGLREWEGEKWSPSGTYDEANIDPTAAIEADFALIDERLGGEMSEAARKFGRAGALMSGGGLGGGYAGTLGESERGAMRDKRQISSNRIFAAKQAEAERRARAFEGSMSREFGGHEGYESRRLGAHGMASNYDWDKYGAELGASEREQEDARREMETMMLLYGM